MESLIKKIEQWAEDRNIIKGSKPIDQAMKLFSEFGELADNVGKGRDCRDDIGDIFVVLTILMRQQGRTIYDYIDGYVRFNGENIKFEVSDLADCLSNLVMHLRLEKSFYSFGYSRSVAILKSIAIMSHTTLEECVQIAYDDIKDRVGILWNGVFVKNTDENYNEVKLMFEKSLENNSN